MRIFYCNVPPVLTVTVGKSAEQREFSREVECSPVNPGNAAPGNWRNYRPRRPRHAGGGMTVRGPIKPSTKKTFYDMSANPCNMRNVTNDDFGRHVRTAQYDCKAFYTRCFGPCGRGD